MLMTAGLFFTAMSSFSQNGGIISLAILSSILREITIILI